MTDWLTDSLTHSLTAWLNYFFPNQLLYLSLANGGYGLLNHENSKVTAEKPYRATEPGILAKVVLTLLVNSVDLAWKFRQVRKFISEWNVV